MKLIFILLYLLQFLSIDSIYDLSIETYDSNTIPISLFIGKMIMIVPFNAALQNNRELDSLNNLNLKNSDSLVVIAVPALEYDSTVTDSALLQLIQSKNLSMIIAKPVYVKKSSEKQDPLFQWLTHVDQNTHFDEDASEGQYFVINNEGTLYAVMKKDASSTLVNDIVANQYDEEGVQ